MAKSLRLALLMGGLSILAAATPIAAQPIGYQDVWQKVYQQMPDLPLENQYVNTVTGKVDPKNTLVSRFIRYHVYVKGRPPIYRLDWKTTLADYLNINELMVESVYPAKDVLQTNPIDGDRAAIIQLTRKQRETLVQTLVNLFNPTPPQTAQPVAPTPSPTPTGPLRPSPGGARLLL